MIQFGAGNIGRSFIAQVFSRNGYDVVFVDVDTELVDELNRRNEYRVVVKKSGTADRIIPISGVRAVDGRDTEAVAEELIDADIAATSVGSGALPKVIPVIAEGFLRREKAGNTSPLDIIIAENIRSGAGLFSRILSENLPADFPLNKRAGLVETSIGKMVPIMREEDLKQDRLWVFGEEYNTLILDKRGFLNPVPDIPEIKAVGNIRAYVDRKLFVHNLGHAAAGYLGFQHNPELEYVYEVMEDQQLREKVRRAMTESAEALRNEYPEEFTRTDLEDHISDLLNRFSNRALGDTIFRVGRDLRRKLSREDRVIGPALLAAKHRLPFHGIAETASAGMKFRGTGEDGRMYGGDKQFAEELEEKGPENMLREVSGLNPEQEPDKKVYSAVLEAYTKTSARSHEASS
ncbi:MAG: mannitol-1-phosphate 5-dehydrogenase [Spirochaetia bacterium]